MNLIKLFLSEPTDTNRSDRVTNTHKNKMRDVNGACMPVQYCMWDVLIGPEPYIIYGSGLDHVCQYCHCTRRYHNAVIFILSTK